MQASVRSAGGGEGAWKDNKSLIHQKNRCRGEYVILHLGSKEQETRVEKYMQFYLLNAVLGIIYNRWKPKKVRYIVWLSLSLSNAHIFCVIECVM